MYCPNCQTRCENNDNFCYLCGTPLNRPKPKKGSLWVPLLILIIMSVSGILLFFATAGHSNSAPAASNGFRIRDGVLYFDASGYTGGSELVIPSKVSGETVITLGKDCFANCTDLTSITLPDTLSSIGEGAFRSCTALRAINIPDQVNIIAEEAFFGCASLEAIRIPGTLQIIREDAFNHCSSLKYIFYDGTYSGWTRLCEAYINPDIGIFCTDGSFYQGGERYE